MSLGPFPGSVLAGPGAPSLKPSPPVSSTSRFPDVLYVFGSPPPTLRVSPPQRKPRGSRDLPLSCSFRVLSPQNRTWHSLLVLPSCQTPCCTVQVQGVRVLV